MKDAVRLEHEFVEYIPNKLQDGTLYISMSLAMVVHKCCCGCSKEVVTPLTPTDWQLTYNGVSITLSPSIGNWNFECQSHYWIKNNRVRWAKRWSREEIDAGRAYDAWSKERYFDTLRARAGREASAGSEEPSKVKSKERLSLWQKLKRWLS